MDTRLRELERRFQATGSVEDEAAWITERLRVGELARDRVELAAYCGHEAACVVLGEEVGAFPPSVDLRRWLKQAPKAPGEGV